MVRINLSLFLEIFTYDVRLLLLHYNIYADMHGYGRVVKVRGLENMDVNSLDIVSENK